MYNHQMKKIIFSYVILFLSLFCGEKGKVIFEENFDKGDEWVFIDAIDYNEGSPQPSAKMFSSNIYACTKKLFEIKPGFCYEVFGLVKTKGDVTSQSQIYAEILDENKKRIKILESEGTKETEWVPLFIKISSDNLPSNAFYFRIWLQSAAGKDQRGTAWFDNIKVIEYPEKEENMGNLIEEEKTNIDIKVSSIKGNFRNYDGKKAIDGVISSGWISNAEKENWFKISWAKPKEINEILIIQNPEYKSDALEILIWDDYETKWIKYTDVKELKEEIKINISDLKTRRLWLIFRNEKPKSSSINEILIYTKEKEEEYWSAFWIAYPEDRAESEYQHRFFIKIFDIEEDIEKAYVQFLGDDRYDVFINGKKINNNCGEVRDIFKKGKNLIWADVYNERYATGFIFEGDIYLKTGKILKIITDKTWKVSKTPPSEEEMNNFVLSSKWIEPQIIARPPKGVWGRVPYVYFGKKIKCEVKKIGIPDEISAGDEKRIEIGLEYKEDFKKDVEGKLVIEKGDIEYSIYDLKISKPFEKIVKGDILEITTIIKINKYFPSGTYNIRLKIPFTEILPNGEIIKRINIKNQNFSPKITIARIIEKNGVPTISINNTPTFCMMYKVYLNFDESYKKIEYRSLSKNGIKFYIVQIPPKEDIWKSYEEYNFSLIDREVLNLLEINPEAYLFLDICLRDLTPMWWIEKNKEELVVFDNGEKGSRPSLCSSKWHNDSSLFLKKLLEYVENSPYGDRIIGYIIGDGEEGQWLHWWNGEAEKVGSMGDYSKPALEGFKNWLKRKYKNDENLKKAWKDENLTFDSVKIPTREERIQTEKGLLKDPVKDRKVIDYLLYLSDVISERIVNYGKLVKEMTYGKKLYGVLYGHLLDVGTYFLAQNGGYLSIEKVIDSPFVDILIGPVSYAKNFRDIGGVASIDFPPPGSLRMRNKLWINEEDIRTHLTIDGYRYSIDNLQKTISVLEREFINVYCNTSGLYWYDMGRERGWFDDEDIEKLIGRLNFIAENNLTYSRKPVSEICVVVEPKSFLYLKPLSPYLSNLDLITDLIGHQREQIARIGAPFDFHLATDFNLKNMPEYKFYIFLVSFYIDEETKNSILKKLKNSNAIVLWLYAPGFITDGGFSLQNMEEITGMKINYIETESVGETEIKNEKFYKFCKSFRTTKPTGLIFYVENPEETYGLLSMNKKPSFCSKKMDGWVSIYSSIPVIPAEILREIAKEAGVHIYSESNDAVYVCENFLGIHINNTGEKKIKFPGLMRIYNLLEDENLGIKDKIEFYSLDKGTKIFLYKGEKDGK